MAVLLLVIVGVGVGGVVGVVFEVVAIAIADVVAASMFHLVVDV